MNRVLKLLLGIALIPAAAGLTRTVAGVLLDLPSRGGGLPPGLWWFIGGFVFWTALWVGLPRPARSYVLAHELTHALWGVVMGARVSKLRVRADGGSVNLTKTNVWITLAPYFFPFYTMLVVVFYAVARLCWNAGDRYDLFWLGLIGLTWGFHVTFTIAVLQQRQPDVQEHGRIFSWTLIYILNLLGLLAWILVITRGPCMATVSRLAGDVFGAYAFLFRHVANLLKRMGP